MEKVDLPEGSKGPWRIERFTTDRQDWSALKARRAVPIGETFTRLFRGQTLVMSDTPAELEDFRAALHMARGHCLINGLGLGAVLKAVLLRPEVTAVTVVEISQDLIDLVGQHYTSDPRVRIVCADAFKYKPPKGERYQMVWHDIWDDICSDNLEGMTRLHRKYARRCDWQESWCRYECRAARRRGI
ncbi:MAG: hypothetical protein WC683_04175 [bacterium]